MLKVKNWEKFQHYKDRNPPWIKLHFEILSSADWVMLDDASRVLAVACMLIASRNDGHVPENPDYIKRVAYLNQKPNFKPLIDCGFLEPCKQMLADASKLQADARPETETETETETEERESKKNKKQVFLESDLSHLSEWFSKNAPSVDKFQLRERMLDWQLSKGKTIKDYDATMRNWARKNHDENVKKGWVKPKIVNLKDPFADVLGR
jgi:hypothetical protein